MKRDNTMTRRYFADAGVMRGMRVMEIGCGSGEVTEVLAELVGSSGTVVAIDRNQDALMAAQERIKEQGIEYVHFVPADVAGDLASLHQFQDESFDVLAGRRVLMYVHEPAKVLRHLCRWLHSGGLVVFEEADTAMVPGRIAPMEAHDQATEWLKHMLIAEGANTAMGFSLPTTLVQAGLTFERIRAEAVIQGQGTQYPLAALVRMLQSRFVATGIATAADVDSLVIRLDAESRDPTSVYISDMSFCAWAYKP